jgi:hypothetical protein
MKRIFTTLACAAAVLLAGCTADSQLPEPTGKGGVRAINAIPGSPVVTFRIEELSLGTLAYKVSSQPVLYDDFEYNFNFDINLPGESEPTRIASVFLPVEVGREHVFVLSGDLVNPVVTTWTTDLRAWTGSETVFEARFAHVAESLGAIDVYFYETSGPLPVQGEQVATLSYGDVMDTADFEDGIYAALITAAGDINTVYHESTPVSLAAQSSHFISLFDGDENETSPYILRSMSTSGQAIRLPDPSFPPTIRFIHGARTLPAIDIYSDEALTDLVAENVALGDATGDFVTVAEETTWYFTPTGSTATVLFEQLVGAPPSSTPTALYLTGDTDQWSGVNLSQDRATVSTLAKVSLYHSAFNANTIDIYILDRGEEVTDDTFPTVRRVGYGLPSNTAALAAGNYDIYVAEFGSRNLIGGPYPLDVALGDVVFLMVIDAVDPGNVDIVDVSLP